MGDSRGEPDVPATAADAAAGADSEFQAHLGSSAAVLHPELGQSGLSGTPEHHLRVLPDNFDSGADLFEAVDSAEATESLRAWVKSSIGAARDERRAGRWSRWLPSIRPGPMPQDVPKTAVGGTTGVLVAMTVIVLFGAAVTSHQLTPYAVFSAVTLLVITGHCRVRGLPVLMAVILVTWTIFVASGYIDGHLEKIATGSGLKTSATSNVTGRLVGSDQHVMIVWERVVLTATAWLLALAGAFYRFRTRHRDHAAALLALAPLPLFLLPYGGEVLMRIYFFMLPFVAFFG